MTPLGAVENKRGPGGVDFYVRPWKFQNLYCRRSKVQLVLTALVVFLRNKRMSDDNSCLNMFLGFFKIVFEDIVTPFATLAAAIFTAWLAFSTRALARSTQELATDTRESSRLEIKVPTWLELKKDFDSANFRQARRELAANLRNYNRLPAANKLGLRESIQERVMDFFEDLGTLYKEGLVHENLTQSAFGFYACRWWLVCHQFITDERNRRDDISLFEDFEFLASQLKHKNDKLDQNDIHMFLNDESNVR